MRYIKSFTKILMNGRLRKRLVLFGEEIGRAQDWPPLRNWLGGTPVRLVKKREK